MSTAAVYQASQIIHDKRNEIAAELVQRTYSRRPELAARYGERGRQRCHEDAGYHLIYLAQSLSVGHPVLFTDYVAWVRVMLAARNIPAEDLILNLEFIREILRDLLPGTSASVAQTYVTAGLDYLASAPMPPASYIVERQPLADLAREYLAALLAGKRDDASQLILSAVDAGASVKDIYLRVFEPCQHEIGRLWQMNNISVAQEHYSTAATQLVMSQLYTQLFVGERTGRSMVATCIAGDLHEIGVRMVADLFELDGWDTFYLGANTPNSGILKMVRDQRADVLAISVTIVPNLALVQELIQLVRVTPETSHVKIIVGGRPFTVAEDLWKQVGADGCAHDAAAAVSLANRLVPCRVAE